MTVCALKWLQKKNIFRNKTQGTKTKIIFETKNDNDKI